MRVDKRGNSYCIVINIKGFSSITDDLDKLSKRPHRVKVKGIKAIITTRLYPVDEIIIESAEYDKGWTKSEALSIATRIRTYARLLLLPE